MIEKIKNLFSFRKEKENDLILESLINFANSEQSIFWFCYQNNYNYHWRSKLRYKLQWYRKKYKESFKKEDWDIERMYINTIMLRYLKNWQYLKKNIK